MEKKADSDGKIIDWFNVKKKIKSKQLLILTEANKARAEFKITIFHK
jgi:hypothetical protein